MDKRIGGRYDLLREIGRGGMARVYLARDCRLNKPWAVKEIRLGEEKGRGRLVTQALLNEAELVKKLDHPAFPRVTDWVVEAGCLYIVMDYIRGRRLDLYIREEGPQEEERLLEWGMEMADALSYLHNQQPPLIYRDLKPSNLILSTGGFLRIVDFGSLRQYKEGQEADTQPLGTQGYAAPEQYGSQQSNVQADIYGLGMTLFYLATAIEPAGGESCQPLRSLRPDLSEGFQSIIDRCLQKDPASRYPDCKSLITDLKHLAALPPSSLKKGGRKSPVLRWGLGLSLTVLFLAVLSFFLIDRQKEKDYRQWMDILPSSPYQAKLDSYTAAIHSRPENPEAYLKMLEVFEEEGPFSKEKSDSFLALFNPNQGDMDWGDKNTYLLFYKLGRLYFNSFEEGGSEEVGERVQRAAPFFQACLQHEEDSPAEELKRRAGLYGQICVFYKKYILSWTDGEEASREEYEEVGKWIRQGLEEGGEMAPYDQLNLYHAGFILLYDQREALAGLGLSEEEVVGLFDHLTAAAAGLSVQKKPALRLQAEIGDHAAAYRQAIKESYLSAQASHPKPSGGKGE